MLAMMMNSESYLSSKLFSIKQDYRGISAFVWIFSRIIRNTVAVPRDTKFVIVGALLVTC
jgi:hypothetical protein